MICSLKYRNVVSPVWLKLAASAQGCVALVLPGLESTNLVWIVHNDTLVLVSSTWHNLKIITMVFFFNFVQAHPKKIA